MGVDRRNRKVASVPFFFVLLSIVFRSGSELLLSHPGSSLFTSSWLINCLDQ